MINSRLYKAILKLAIELEDPSETKEDPFLEESSLQEDVLLTVEDTEPFPTSPNIPKEFSRKNISLIEEKLQRPIAKTRAGLGVKPAIKDGRLTGRGKSNIIKVYNEATDEEKDYWGSWYNKAQQDVRNLANYFNMNFEVVAAIVATLSPGNKWVDNLLAAQKLINGAAVIHAYPANIQKSLKIKETNVPVVSGPKVSIFYESLINPNKVNNDIVLDGHAINIWLGKKTSLKGVGISKSLREKIIDDYRSAASELGKTPQAVQATTWFIWKCLPYDKISPAPNSINPEFNSSSLLKRKIKK